LANFGLKRRGNNAIKNPFEINQNPPTVGFFVFLFLDFFIKLKHEEGSMITMHVYGGTDRVIISGVNGNDGFVAKELLTSQGLKNKISVQLTSSQRGASQEELKVALLNAIMGDDVEIFIHRE